MAYTTIKKPSDYFNTVTYTGDGTSSRNITGVGFQPDLLWIKNRDITQWHFLFDAVRGVSKALFSNVTNAESTQASTQTAFLSDGFTVGNDVASNGNGNGIVSWNWLGANGTASNTDGSITSTVSANTTSGFSIVSYTGTGANATVGHGLGSDASMVLIKNRDATNNWFVHHKDIGGVACLNLDTTDIPFSPGTAAFQNPPLTSSLIQLATNVSVNNSGQNYIAYCFSEVKGFSKFGSYVGNGNADGTFVYTGFKPAFVMFKDTTSAGDWTIQDSARDTFNLADARLYANLNNSENDGSLGVDFLSNGIKIRTSSVGWNRSNTKYIYMAFASNPFVTSTGIPTCAR